MSVYASNEKITIDLSKLLNFSQICDIMKKYQIENYVYEFNFNGEVIKYGMSSDQSRHYGERIYRQAGHLEGWPTGMLVGPSGSEMYFINKDYHELTGRNLNRNGMKIIVTNLSKQNKLECEKLEKYLIETYITIHGKAPIGNKDTKTKFYVRKHNNTKHFNELFSFNNWDQE